MVQLPDVPPDSFAIREIYAHYLIMPSLQQHMYRVAAVAQILCEACEKAGVKVKEQEIVSAALLHDTGNILKSDLTLFPDFVELEGLEYWESVKAAYQTKHGQDEHEATRAIAKELSVSTETLELIESISFSKIESLFADHDLNALLLQYADLRVGPHGVITLEERLQDLEKRYASRHPGPDAQARREKFGQVAREIEQDLSQTAGFNPDAINDESVKPYLEKLPFFEIT